MPPAAVPSARGTAPISRLAVMLMLAASQLIGLGPGPVRGAASLPDEPGAIRIDGPSYAALVADVDGDGIPELVRVTGTGGDGTGIGVEVWRQATDGSWGITALAVPLFRGHGGADNLVAAVVGDGVRLLSWHLAGKERVLAVVNAGNAETDGAACCLTVWDVSEPPGGGAPALRLLINTHQGGGIVFAVDMDADGTDELAVPVPGGETAPPSFSVLKWSAGTFKVLSQPLNAGELPVAYLLGNTDGLPGDEMGFIGSFGPNGEGFGLTRVSLRKGLINAETAELPGSGVVVGDEGRILFGDAEQPLLAFSWPADKDVTEVARSSRQGTPVGVIGSGVNRRVLMLRGNPPTLDLIGRDLTEGSVQTIAPSDAARPFLKRTFRPYIGPWLGSLPDNAEGAAYDGMLLVAEPGAPIQRRPIAALPGTAPLGQLGRKGEWTALGQRTTPTPRPSELAREGGLLLQTSDASITLVRSTEVLTPEAGGGVFRPAVEDGVIDARAGTPTSETLLIGTPAFEATLTAPPGSISMTVTGSSDQFHLLVQSPVQNPGPEIGGPPFRIPIASSNGSPGNQAFDATLHVITLAGHGYTAAWHVRLLRSPPKITVESAFVSLGFGATIQGQTDPSATVTVDGQSIRAGPDGRFQLSVPAGLIPREVHVQARDPVGNVASITVSVIAPLDYRRLPWLPIVALLTVAAGAVLFLRAPGPARRRAESVPADDATLEEIDGD